MKLDHRQAQGQRRGGRAPPEPAPVGIPGWRSSSTKNEYILTIPPIELKNIGTGEGAENGAAIKDVVTLLVTRVAPKAAESEQLPPELRHAAQGRRQDMLNVAKAKLGEEVNKQVGKVDRPSLKKKLGRRAGRSRSATCSSDPNKLKQDPGKAIEEGLGGLINRRRASRRRSRGRSPTRGQGRSSRVWVTC